jgi:PD-(D/E)XK nuclease superfamily
MKEYYDNTKLGDYKKCPRYYYLRHVKGWRPQGTSMPLIFGLCWHDAMDVIWTGYEKVKQGVISKRDLVEAAMYSHEQLWIESGMKPFAELGLQDFEILGARTPMIAQDMLINYIEKREGILYDMELLAAERPFAVPLYPDRDDIWYIGRRDKDIRLHGDIVIIEHKTTSEYKVDGGFKTSYVESWYPNSQCEGYLYAGKLEYNEPVRYVWVDAALVHKKVHDTFKFIPVSATFAALDSWLWEARDWASRITSEMERLAEQSPGQPVMGAFPKNTGECCGKYGLCSMLNICRGYSNPAQVEEAPAGYIHDPWNPFDLLKIADIGMKKE